MLGEEAPISASTVARLKTKWQAEFAEWSSRRLDDLEVVYLWVDGIYVKAGLEKEKAALLAAIAGLSGASKVVVAVQPGHRESIEGWSPFLRDLKQLITFFNYPEEHWRRIRTINPVESPFASVRLRTNAAKRFKKVENATAVLWKMLMIAERRFKRLKAPELTKRVFEGLVYVDGRGKQLDNQHQAA